MYGNSDTRFSTIREIFSRALTIGNLNQNFAHFLKYRIKKIPAFFDIWYIAIWISRFLFHLVYFEFPALFLFASQKCGEIQIEIPPSTKKCGKFKLKFPNVKKCGKIQITRTLKQVSHFLHFLYFSTFYYFCNVFQRNTLKKNGGKNKIQTEYMHIMMYF